MTSIKHCLKTKGVVNTIRRIGMISYRYSLNGFLKSFNIIIDLLENYDAKATFPITAITLKRNIDTIKEIKSKSIEWAMHGYIHKDYTTLNRNAIINHIEKGKKIFNNANIKISGFRTPYLSTNKMITSILSEKGFSYDSSKSYYVNVIPFKLKKIKIILDYYKPLDKWMINEFNGMKEIPICFPDDEILVDRLKFKGEKIGQIWIEMCQKLMNNGGIPVIGLHPERGRICKKGLEMVLEWARKKDLNLLCLEDIAKGKYENGKVIAITGDIDIIKISDFRYMKKE